MRVTLASYLADAVQDIKKFRDGDITAKDYMEWCDKYQVGDEHYNRSPNRRYSAQNLKSKCTFSLCVK